MKFSVEKDQIRLNPHKTRTGQLVVRFFCFTRSDDSAILAESTHSCVIVYGTLHGNLFTLVCVPAGF
jgi:hypothetical protein